MKDLLLRLGLGFVLIAGGSICVFIPHRVFSLILDLTIVYCLVNCMYLAYMYGKEKKRIDLLFSLLSFAFVVFLKEYVHFPEWIIRVIFGTYCLVCGVALLVQWVLRMSNGSKHKLGLLLMAVLYTLLGGFLLLTPNFDTDLLMQFFGLYFVVLGIQYLHDAWESVQPEMHYQWKRKIRIMLPPFLCVFLPDWAIGSINKYLAEGKSPDLFDMKLDDSTPLKVMVHIGPEGLQKVGHICFAYEDVVYSYGNYDADSFRLNQTLGDGTYFNVPLEKYIPNAMRVENNSIFEYGIHLTKEQRSEVEKRIKELEDRSYRWYCKIEKEDGYDDFDFYRTDYPSRLHYRTGAKFYKLKRGKFKTYWVLGDNCASFIDMILGVLGSDVLSVRGIITPGTYFDFLETEYQKKGSPIVYRTVHPWNKQLAQNYEEIGRTMDE